MRFHLTPPLALGMGVKAAVQCRQLCHRCTPRLAREADGWYKPQPSETALRKIP